MLLAVDVGNTNVVFAICEGRAIKARWRIATDPRRTADQYAVWLIQLMEIEGIARESIDQLIVSTVVPRAMHNLDVLAQKYFKLTPIIAGQHPAGWGFQADIDEPRSLGADRAVNIVAAHDAHPGDLIIVDFGTATTFDAVSAKGDYLGGIICPGPQVSADALFQRAAKLPRIEVRKPARAIGTNTVAAMQSGTFFGYVDMVEGLVKRMKAELGGAAVVVATGGLASMVAPESKVIEHVDPELTLRGLRLWWERRPATD